MSCQHNLHRKLVALALGLGWIVPVIVPAGHAEAGVTGLSVEQRIAARRAIEEVYWRHRIWPTANPGRKPRLEDVLPETSLRRQVDDSLRLSEALARRWQQPITASDLQAELDRMIAESQDPERLAELFAALDNDPVLAAECLARPLLADRRARAAFARDHELSGAIRRGANEEWEAFRHGRPLRFTRGVYREVEWVRSGPDRPRWELMAEEDSDGRLVLDPATWRQLDARLTALVGDARLGEPGPLRDEEGAFSVSSVLDRDEDHVLIATVTWPKPSFDHWWAAHRDRFAAATPPPGDYRLTPLKRATAPTAGWTSTDFTTITAPGGRAYHSAVWTGSEMIVYGGITIGDVLADGARYFPDSNSWLTLPAADGPGERALHSAVWSGQYMVVFGGWSGSSTYLRSGARYSPTDNAWYSMSTTNAPTVRAQHGAVWSGIFMFVYGGFNGSGYPSDGGVYLPGAVGGTWFPMDTTGAPGGRIGHATVMCDTLDDPTMVVWGGEAGGGPLGTGGRFNQGTFSWSSMSNVGQPSPRTNLTGVWGSALDIYRKVLLWGGNNGSVDLNQGAGYDPVADTWETLATTTLEARQGHTAVWTNYTMIVWGGSSGSTVYGNGRIYNPVNRVWSNVTNTGAPSARVGHTAVWRSQASGQAGQMIVWGGDDGTYSNRGGVFTPSGDYVFAMNPMTFSTTREGNRLDAVHALLLTLNGLSYSLTVSENLPLVYTTYTENPISAGANGFGSTTVDVEVDGTYPVGDYPIVFTGDGGDSSLNHQITMRVQDYGVSCTPSTLNIPLDGSADTTCTVDSENGFSQAVYMSCNGTWATCEFSASPVTPPGNGTATTIVTVTPYPAPLSFTHDVRAMADGASRYFELQINVTDEIFADDFELGNLSRWSSSVP